MNLIRAAALVPKPWKNGGGVTREIDAEPKGAPLDAFIWRLSIANVDTPGAFSTFAGIDRTLVLLEGAGMHLHEANGRVHALDAPLAMASFAGETQIDATLVDGPTRDFNVMVRRDRARATVQAHRDESRFALADDITIIFCVQGEIALTLDGEARCMLQANDTLRLDASAAQACEITCVQPHASWLRIGIVITDPSR
jgi:environmental stress-induced protein Ves